MNKDHWIPKYFIRDAWQTQGEPHTITEWASMINKPDGVNRLLSCNSPDWSKILGAFICASAVLEEEA